MASEMSNDNFVFISNNVRGIQNSNKRNKLFHYFKSNFFGSSGFLFLQETHSSEEDERHWRNDFDGELFFSHGNKKSCGVAIGFYGN